MPTRSLAGRSSISRRLRKTGPHGANAPRCASWRKIDEVRRKDDAGDRARLRQRMMRLLDTASERLSGGGPYEPHRLAQSAISMSDLLNTDLRFARISDADLTMQCPHCTKESRLSACRIATGRKTTYFCSQCAGVLVVLAPAVERLSVRTTGYCIGGFEVQTEADINCRGAILPSWCWPGSARGPRARGG